MASHLKVKLQVRDWGVGGMRGMRGMREMREMREMTGMTGMRENNDYLLTPSSSPAPLLPYLPLIVE
ncbi:hypothetical protein JYQ62_21445 [Nostoc sp. UHCC 0702]|nr:hypothetical protein JYQ62_21445 [Nostoc sp. UHCC 0702]